VETTWNECEQNDKGYSEFGLHWDAAESVARVVIEGNHLSCEKGLHSHIPFIHQYCIGFGFLVELFFIFSS
jgi:hypothetical protein